MHELKTPITKGRITAEMIEDGKNKQRLISTFEKLESLLNEFIQIEQITVNNTLINKEIVKVSSTINEAVKIAMINKNQIKIDIKSDYDIKVDKKLFTLAIKNLIDNGIKYSSNKVVEVKVTDTHIEFLSLGAPLKEDLSYYIEPFTQEDTKVKNGFGLGLYIVDSILKAHNLKLKYKHENGKNVFVIEGIVKVF